MKTGAPANVFTIRGGESLEWFDPSSGEWEDCTLSGKMTGEAGEYTLSLLSGDAILLKKAGGRAEAEEESEYIRRTVEAALAAPENAGRGGADR